LIWSEALNRATVFLTVLSASIVALALLADATGFGPQTTRLALVLLPVVLLLGIATYVRLVRINTEEYQLVLAMNRLRHAYLKIEPGLEPLLHHQPPRRRERRDGHLHGRSAQPAGVVGAFPDQHADHRGDCGRGLGGGHCRPGPAGPRGAEGRGGGRWGGGVPGGVGRAVSAAATFGGPGPRQDAKVADAAGHTLVGSSWSRASSDASCAWSARGRSRRGARLAAV
jgi:hypothetical protein